MADVTTEFEKATEAVFTEEDFERARLLLGVDTPIKNQEHITTASYDSIRNFAWGVGDNNPLYTDEHYGASTRWGSQVAPNIMSQIMGAPMLGDPMPDDVKRAAKGLFSGIHVFVSGGSNEWFRPILPGDRIVAYAGEESIEVKDSEFSGTSVIQVRRSVRVNQRGEIVAIQRVVRVLTERKKARERGKNSTIEPASYTDEDLRRIEEIHAQEGARGADPRYWEDVAVGDDLPAMAKGPLTTTEIIAFHAGGYGFAPYGLKASRLAYENRQRIPAFFVKNDQGVPDVAQRLHWDSEWAKAIGNPRAYDYGVMRQTWLHHYLTDWAGDDAFVLRQEDSMRKFNYQGDTQFISGAVTQKRQTSEGGVVDIEMQMTNQRGEKTTFGTATIALPSRTGGAVVLPVPEVSEQRKATEMYTRHLQLAAERRR